MSVKNFKNKDIDVWSEAVGPKHDPYDRTTIEVKDGVRTVRIILCSLAGDGVSVDGGRILWDYEVDMKRPGAAERTFVALTGMTSREAEAYYYENYDPDPMGGPEDYR